MSRPLSPDDPAYFMLLNGVQEQLQTPDTFNWRSRTTVYADNCYICLDPEFALMGMPLCRPCAECSREGRQGHVPADDTVCTVCGHDDSDDYNDNNDDDSAG